VICYRALGIMNVINRDGITYEGKWRGSESGGPSEGISTRLLGVFVGDELGNGIGDELAATQTFYLTQIRE
jgi:hypothetical protein